MSISKGFSGLTHILKHVSSRSPRYCSLHYLSVSILHHQHTHLLCTFRGHMVTMHSRYFAWVLPSCSTLMTMTSLRVCEGSTFMPTGNNKIRTKGYDAPSFLHASATVWNDLCDDCLTESDIFNSDFSPASQPHSF